MKKLNKMSLIAAMLLSVSVANADDVIIKTASGVSSYSIESIKNITFQESGIAVNQKNNNTETFTFASIKTITFGNSTAIATPNVDKNKFNVAIDAAGNNLTVYGITENKAVNIYNLSGINVKQITHWNGEQINISDLSNGVYIIKIGNQTIKFIK